MRSRVALIVAGTILTAACGSASPEPAEVDVAASLVRLGGVVCRVDLIAGGVFIDSRLILTAAHPIAGSFDGVTVETLDGRAGTGVVVGFDPNRDLAVLKVEGLEGNPLELGDASVGEAGSIWTIDRDRQLGLVDYEVEGLINATGDDIYGEGDVARRALRLAAEIGPGMSGSPVVGRLGQVLGIVFAESRNTATAYAVASEEVEAFLSEFDPDTPVTPGRCR